MSKRLLLSSLALILIAVIVFVTAQRPWRKNMDYVVVPSLVTSTAPANKVLDPSQLFLLSPYRIAHNVTRQLINLGRDGEYQRSTLLSKFEVLNQNLGIRGTIAENAKFSDGTPILARDVLKTFLRLIVNGSAHTTPKEMIKCASEVKTLQDSCSGLIEINESTFEIHFNKPVKEIMYYLQMADYAILHSSQYSKTELLTLEDWKITSGYYFLTLLPSGEMLLKANPYHLSEKQIPQVLFKRIETEQEYLNGITKGDFHLGSIGFKHYRALREKKNAFDNYDLVVDRHSWVTGLVLNTKSELFANPSVRKWVYKRIFENFKAPSDYAEITEKALQFFLPSAPGRLLDSEIRAEVAKFEVSDEPPEILKKGFRIRAAQKLDNLYPIEAIAELQRVLAPIKVEYVDDVAQKDYVNFKKNRDFDAFLIVTSMSYKEPTESLNLSFTSDAPTLTDPDGIVRKLITEEHATLDDKKAKELTRQILLQMISDAEFIPMLYVGSFFYAHKQYLDASDVHFWESTQYHSFKTK